MLVFRTGRDQNLHPCAQRTGQPLHWCSRNEGTACMTCQRSPRDSQTTPSGGYARNCRGPHFAWSMEDNLTSPRRGDDFSGTTAETMLLTRICLTCEPPVEIVSFDRRAMPSVVSPGCARSVGSSRERASRPCSGPFSLNRTPIYFISNRPLI